jgi:hypothetical protein
VNDLEARIRDVLQEDASRAPLVVRMPEQVRPRIRRRQAVTTAIGSMAAIAVIAGSVFAFHDLDRDRTAPEHHPAASPSWSPVREGGVVYRGRTWPDPHDAPVGWVDVTRVRFYMLAGEQPTWQIELAAAPPPASDREPGLLIAYGLVLDTTGDGIADYLVGIDNDAPKRGDFHVWVTDLATGGTDEQIGPPYGSPIEFAYPHERGSGPPTMTFTSLGGSQPAAINPATMRFYAWASETRDSEVLARDYAPDTGWLTRP